jgi:hypothetical protein
MPRDSCHFNLIWILIQLFVRFLVGGSLFLLGGVVGALLQVYWGTPFWIPVPLLILALLGKRIYCSALLLGIQVTLLGEIIH